MTPQSTRDMRKHGSDAGIVQLPKIAPHLHIDIVEIDPSGAGPDKSMLITSEYDKNYYQIYPIAELGEMLLAAIDGDASATQLIQRITSSSRYSHLEVAAMLSLLSNADIIISGRYDMPDGQAALWLNMGFTPALVENTTSRLRVAIVDKAESPAYQQELGTMLRSLGVNTSDGDVLDSDLTVVVVDDYLHKSLNKINRDYLKKKIRWLPVKLSGNVHWAGPVFNQPNRVKTDSELVLEKPYMAKDFCWYCLAERIENGRQIEQAKYRQTDLKPRPASKMYTPALQASAYNITLEIIKYLLHADQETEFDVHPFCSSSWVWDQISNRSDWHIVNKNPACVVCEQPSTDDIDPIHLDDVEIGERYVSSGWRIVPIEQTFENYRHLNNAYTGVIDLFEDIQNPVDDFCFVSESSNNISTKSNAIFFPLMSVRMRNAGKGITPASARTGALCESIERYSTSLHGAEIRRRARYQDFPAGQALMPNCFMNFSDKQFVQNQQGNQDASGNPFVNIPARLTEYEYCEWSPVWSFTQQQTIWTPTQSLYFGYPYKNRWIAIPDTNGVAAGNTRTEAFVQAFLEVLERDAVSIWWYNQLQCRELDLDSIDIPFIRRVVDQYEKKNRRCWVLDITFDLGVNIFVFLSRKNSSATKGEEICLGCAAHFDPEIALTRAICEHSQLWTMIENRREKTFFKKLSPAFSAWLQNATTMAKSLKYLLPAGKKQWCDYPLNLEFNLLQQRQACLKMVEENGWQLYLADFTRPSIGLSVIRVMIPELRSMHRRLGPGRLYDVPVEMGLLKCAKIEEEMNEIDIFI